MLLAAESLDFERAAELRDRMRRLDGGEGAEGAKAPKKRAAAKARTSNRPPAARARRR
jgi:hypothetical protein